jgi:hypothetical protein
MNNSQSPVPLSCERSADPNDRRRAEADRPVTSSHHSAIGGSELVPHLDVECLQRDRWLRFIARQIAQDILRVESAKEGGQP